MNDINEGKEKQYDNRRSNVTLIHYKDKKTYVQCPCIANSFVLFPYLFLPRIDSQTEMQPEMCNKFYCAINKLSNVV